MRIGIGSGLLFLLGLLGCGGECVRHSDCPANQICSAGSFWKWTSAGMISSPHETIAARASCFRRRWRRAEIRIGA